MLVGPLAGAIRADARTYPAIDLRIHEMAPDRQIALLESGQTDVCFLRCPPPNADLIHERAEAETVRLVLPWRHRLVGAPVSFADLAGERFVFLRLADYPTATYLWDRCVAAGFTPIVAQQAVEAASLTSLVAAGLGIAIIPEFVARLAHEDVIYAPLEGRPIRADVYAFWMRAKQPRIENFVRLVQGGESAKS
jgi:DNA-binding transcriptional LysR family regulator